MEVKKLLNQNFNIYSQNMDEKIYYIHQSMI